MDTVDITETFYRLELMVGRGFDRGPVQNLGLVFSRYARLKRKLERSSLTSRVVIEKEWKEDEPFLRGFLVTNDREIDRALTLVSNAGTEVVSIVGDEVSPLARLKAEEYGWDIF